MQRTLLTLLFLIVTAIGTGFGDVYRIREGDTLLIAIIGQPEYTQTVQVREDGMMSYFSGELHVAGKTADEISRRIRDVLVSENLVSNPVIMVSPVPQENGIFVGGAVKNPGALRHLPPNGHRFIPRHHSRRRHGRERRCPAGAAYSGKCAVENRAYRGERHRCAVENRAYGE